MRRTGEVDGGSVLAWMCVLGAHLAFWWLLTRGTALPEPAGATRDALQVAWIEPSQPPPPAPVAPARPSAPAAAPTPRHAPLATAPEATGAAAPASHRITSAIFIEQARELVRTRGGGGEPSFMPDPLAHRRARLPGPDAERFGMRAPPSLRGALLRIGAMAGGPGYTTDPCPRIVGNIGELSQQGDSALLQEELRRKRALCD